MLPLASCPSCGFNQEDNADEWRILSLHILQCPICAACYTIKELAQPKPA